MSFLSGDNTMLGRDSVKSECCCIPVTHSSCLGLPNPSPNLHIEGVCTKKVALLLPCPA